ncbi:hypothetical protein [Nonomuraea sp. NPDC005501]
MTGSPSARLSAAARQGERFAHLFATGRIAVRLIHAVSRPAVQPMEET